MTEHPDTPADAADPTGCREAAIGDDPEEDGMVAEGPTTNFFLVDKDGVLCTPPESSVLLGVTRRSIMELAVKRATLGSTT